MATPKMPRRAAILALVMQGVLLELQGDKVCKEKPHAADIYLGQL